METDSGKGGTNDAPLLSSPTVSLQGLGKSLALLPLPWNDKLSGGIRELLVQTQLCKDPHGRWDELVKTLTTTTPDSGRSHWTKVESASKGSTFA